MKNMSWPVDFVFISHGSATSACSWVAHVSTRAVFHGSTILACSWAALTCWLCLFPNGSAISALDDLGRCIGCLLHVDPWGQGQELFEVIWVSFCQFMVIAAIHGANVMNSMFSDSILSTSGANARIESRSLGIISSTSGAHARSH